MNKLKWNAGNIVKDGDNTKIYIANNTGITINKSDLCTGKIVVNGVEVTDTKSWNKAVSTFSDLEWQIKEKDKEIDRLNNIINKATNIYLKELNKCNKNGTYVSKVAVDMFNVLEGNK